MKNALLTLFVATLSWQCATPPAEEAAVPIERPAIVGIANFVIKTGDLEESRKFYGGYLGYSEVFQHTRTGVAGDLTVFKINDSSFIEVSPTLADKADDKFVQFGLETTDAQQLRDYMAQEGYEVPSSVDADADGNLSFLITDPSGHRVEFVQYLDDSKQSAIKGEYLTDERISDTVLHVGLHVFDEAQQNSLFVDMLGFRPLWRGGMTEEKAEWINYMVPDGPSWIEYMMSDPQNPPDAKSLGGMHHICLAEHEDMQKAYDTVVARGYHGDRPPSIARDGRWLLHMFDENGTRTELMIRKPVETPCCSELTDPYID